MEIIKVRNKRVNLGLIVVMGRKSGTMKGYIQVKEIREKKGGLSFNENSGALPLKLRMNKTYFHEK